MRLRRSQRRNCIESWKADDSGVKVLGAIALASWCVLGCGGARWRPDVRSIDSAAVVAERQERGTGRGREDVSES